MRAFDLVINLIFLNYPYIHKACATIKSRGLFINEVFINMPFEYIKQPKSEMGTVNNFLLSIYFFTKFIKHLCAKFKTMIMRRKLNLLTVLFVLCGLLANAQETTSEIQGIVSDNAQVPLPGATIVAIHQPTGTRYVTTSRKDGLFNLANLRVGGPYIITTTYIGYNEGKQEDVFLALGTAFKADFKLTTSLATLNEVVLTSRKSDKVFSNSRTGSQEIISRVQIERLPTINRSFQDFTKLTPSSNGLSFGGVNAAYNNLTVDGANFNNSFGLAPTLGGQTNSQPISIDAIEQIQVNISPYDVKQGNFTGASINSVTRSGTNKFKASVYNIVRNNNLAGYKVNAVQIAKPVFDYNQYGATIGGPIIKNKLFFFASYEQEKINSPASDFKAAKPGQVPGGVISQALASDLTALKAFLMDKFNYDPGQYENYNYRTESKKATVRIDWNINAKNTFTLKYNYLRSSRDIAASNSGALGTRQPSTTGLPFSGNGYTINNDFNIVIAELNTRISNKISNKIQAGYSAFRDYRSSLGGKIFPLVDILNSTQNNTYTSFGYEPFTYNNKLNTDIYQLSDFFSIYKGNHEISVGTQLYYKKYLNGFAPNYAGLYRFISLQSFYDAVNNPSVPQASLYRLQYSTASDGSFPFAKIGAYELGFFAQDKWKITSEFTVTYGVRADIPVFENKFASNDSLKSLTFRDGIKIDVGQRPRTQVLFSPRAGFNWDVTGDKRTQIRGGIGLFAGPPPFVWISNQASNNGVQFGSFSRGPAAVFGQPLQPFSDNIDAFRGGTAGKLSANYNIAVTDKNFKYPQNLKASLAIDRKLPGNWAVTVEANYSHDVNAVYFQNINLPSTGVALVGADNRIRFSASQIYSGAGGATLSNPNISDVILMRNASKGYAYFLTLQIQKSYNNFNASIAYTYSQAKTINDGGSIAQSNWRDRPTNGNPNASDISYANFYQPHRVIAYATYRKEYAKYFATSVGITFEAAPNGTTSYVYSGDLTNNGSGGNNSLVYIPRNKSEIVLVKSSNTDPRTADQMWAQLDNYINQDIYLSSHRGKYAERNAALAPYFKRLNLNVTQEFFIITKDKNRHTVKVTFDIFNVGNLINKQWGIGKTFNSNSFLRFTGINSDGRPAFTFPYLDNTNQIPLVNSYRDETGIGSRWQGQVGLRYLFN